MSDFTTTYHVEGTGPDVALVVTTRICDRDVPGKAEYRYLLGRTLAIEIAQQLTEAAMRPS